MNLVTGLGVVYILAESDDDCNEVGMIMMILMMTRVRRVGFFNFGSGRVRVLKKYFGSGRVGYRVFVSNTKSIGYYGVLKS